MSVQIKAGLPKERIVEGTRKLLTGAKASYMGTEPIIYAVPIVSPGHFRLNVHEGVRIAISAHLDIEETSKLTVIPFRSPRLESIRTCD